MEHITLYQKPEDCCGCGACAAVCPHEAIQMVPDETGHIYPMIREDTCVKCRKCLQVCQKQKGIFPICAYAALGKNSELVKNSASGGVFASLAGSCMEQGAMAAGAVMDRETGDVRHILSDCVSDITAMQGSKYVQSRADGCYKPLQKALQAGKTVLFSGTPCQCEAIKRLTGDPENLFTVDLICHGVPSGQMFRDFLRILGKRLGGEVKDFCFRDKESPKAFTARFRIQKKNREKTYRLRSQYLSYYKYFLEADSYRNSCYSCRYACMERVSDLTIGDYWGMEDHHPKEMAGQAWSCVLVNTEKGRSFLEQYGRQIRLVPTEAVWVAEKNTQLRRPSKKGHRWDEITQAYTRGGYPSVERLFLKEQGGRLRFAWRMHKAKRKMEK